MLTGLSVLRAASVFALAASFGGSFAAATPSLPPHLVNRVTQAIDADADRLVNVYKDIHAHPELGFLEVRTAKIVADALTELGYDVTTGIGKTGVVGVLKNGDGPVLMLRADMDAVPVRETTGLPYASDVTATNLDGLEVPVGHLCGHDAHTTWGLGAAKFMAENRNAWAGTLIVVGQPSEESITGAVAMVEDGLYTTHAIPQPDFLIAAHTMPVPTGFVAAQSGLLMAGTEQLDVTFYGIGGHGSTPQLTKDPVIMAAMAIAQYQVIVSRVVDPRDTAVITVGAVQAGSENNVIPAEALLKINLRFFDDAVHEKIVNSIQRINEGIARTYGMPEDQMPTMVRKGRSGPLANDPEMSSRLAQMLDATGLVPEGVVTDLQPVTGSEDAHMLVEPVKDAKITYFAIGTAPADLFAAAVKAGRPVPFGHHEPSFTVDLDAIPFGTKIMTLAALEMLRPQ